MLLVSPLRLAAQSDKGTVELTAGIELRSLVPISVFTPEPVTLREPDDNFVAQYSYQAGTGFGGVIRVRFSKLWSLETGIYYTRRKLEYQIEDPSVGFSDTTPLRMVGYEIPVKGLVYIQMGKNIYMDVALGVSADFFASDAESRKSNWDVIAFKRNWIRAAVLGNIGVEYRTKESGYFYLGATFHQPFGDIMSTQINYYRNSSPPAYFRNGTIDGTYFSVDLRYFFPPQKSRKKNRLPNVEDW